MLSCCDNFHYLDAMQPPYYITATFSYIGHDIMISRVIRNTSDSYMICQVMLFVTFLHHVPNNFHSTYIKQPGWRLSRSLIIKILHDQSLSGKNQSQCVLTFVVYKSNNASTTAEAADKGTTYIVNNKWT